MRPLRQWIRGRWFLWLALSLSPISSARAPAQERPDFSTDPDDRTACRRQLNRIHDALQMYRRQHGGKLPDMVSDLTPDYIYDPDVLVCPFVRKRGGLRTWKKQFRDLSSDPYASYSYEFPPVPLHHNEWRGLPRKTVRELKERQAEVIGHAVPIVRCHDHRPWLNVGLGGAIYETETVYWENDFVEDEHTLLAVRLFPPPPSVRAQTVADFPPRPADAAKRLLDLTEYYNATLTNAWQGFPGNDLASLPTGIQRFDGVNFDVRGVIQLRCSAVPADFPAQVAGIPVRQKCSRIHFLHAGSMGYKSGSLVATYQVDYADGTVLEFPIIVGRELGDWWRGSRKSEAPEAATIAWTGENEASKASSMVLCLYRFPWNNPLKDTEITSITLTSAFKTSYAGPFVVAITLE